MIENEGKRPIQEIKFKESMGRILDYSWILMWETVLKWNRK